MTAETRDQAGDDLIVESVESAGSAESGQPEEPRKKKGGLITRLRAYFFAGILVTAPVAITFYLAWLFISFVDGLIPLKYHPATYLPIGVPGLGLLIIAVGLTLIGWLTAGILGRWVVRGYERVLNRTPIIRSLYGATKQIVETMLTQQSKAFRQVVMIEYPRRGIWTLGFITGITDGEVQNLTEDEVVNVFVPTTPNPTSGFLLFVPRNDIVFLAMTVEEGIKMVISGGMVAPPDRRAPDQQMRPTIPARTVPVREDA